MPADNNEFVTTAELNELSEAVLSDLIKNQGAPTTLDNVATPDINLFLSKGANGNPRAEQTTNAGIRYQVRGRRRQRIEWFNGTQRLSNFKQSLPDFHLTFKVGKGHQGDLVPYELLERLGYSVKYGERLDGGKMPARAANVVVNYLTGHWEELRRSYLLDLAIRAWTSNVGDAASCFLGYEDLFPVTTNSSGEIGTQSRTDLRLRHILRTSVTHANIAKVLGEVQLATEIAAGGDGSKWDVSFVGDEMWDVIYDHFFGSTNGKVAYQAAVDQVQKIAERLRVGIPPDAFMGPNGQAFIRPGTWREIDALYPSLAVPMSKRMAVISWGHLDFHTEKHLESLAHPMPYDQLVQFTSLFGSYVLGTDKPGMNGWVVAA
jgi:hypothetical protein